MAAEETWAKYSAFLYQIEPGRLIDAFMARPPVGYTMEIGDDGTPVFVSRFDVLTTLDPKVRRRLLGVPLLGRWLKR